MKVRDLLYCWNSDKGRLEYWFQGAWLSYEELPEELK